MDGRGRFREGLALASAMDALGGGLQPVMYTLGSREDRGARTSEPLSRAVMRVAAEGDGESEGEGEDGGDGECECGCKAAWGVDSEKEAWLSPWLNPRVGLWSRVWWLMFDDYR